MHAHGVQTQWRGKLFPVEHVKAYAVAVHRSLANCTFKLHSGKVHTQHSKPQHPPYAAAEAVSAFSGLCIQLARGLHTTDAPQPQAHAKAASVFASTSLSCQQLKCLLEMPWQKAASTAIPFASQSSTAPGSSQAKIATLLIQATAAVLGFAELSSADFSSKQDNSGFLHRALLDSDNSVQAAAALVLPVIVANTAEAAKGSARGQPSVGIRLLEKGMDCLSALLHGEAAQTGLIRTAVASGFAGFVSMQAVVEHRLFALCKAAQGLMMVLQTSNDSRISSSSSDGRVAQHDCISGLDCWLTERRQYHELRVTGHGGATVPLKALKGFADALLFSKEGEAGQDRSHQDFHKVITLPNTFKCSHLTLQWFPHLQNIVCCAMSRLVSRYLWLAHQLQIICSASHCIKL